MKKTFILSAFAVLLLATSCGKDFVTVRHNSSEPLDEYFINESRMYEGLIAAYDPLQWYDYFYQYTSLNFIYDIMADDIYCGGSNEGDQPGLVKIHYFTSTPTETIDVPWTTSFSGINRCCHVLENVDGVPGMSEETKTLYKAEATVLKAYYYSVLWKIYGSVPYYDQNLTAPYTAPQLNEDEIYENIVTRLEEAIEWGVLPMKQDPANYGRVTLAMAYMLYTECVMIQNDESRYAKALGYMEEIISSGLYDLVDDFASIWEETGEWGMESIWEINYVSENGVRSWDAPIACGGSVYPVLIGIPGGTDRFSDGWGFSPVPESAYLMYEEGDQRRDGGIYNHLAVVPDYMESGSARWQCEGYFLLKYMARNNGNHGYSGDPNMNHGNNQRIYRYAETLLNAAELALRTGGNGQEWLQKVCDRAGSTMDYSIDGIIDERRKEFLGEGKRYFDLVRTGKASTVLTAANHKYRNVSWTENKRHLPIPQSEIDKDPNLVQNNY